MKEKPTPSKAPKRPPGGAVDEDRNSTKNEPRRGTRPRIRRIVERHRETFDKLAE